MHLTLQTNFRTIFSSLLDVYCLPVYKVIKKARLGKQIGQIRNSGLALLNRAMKFLVS